MGYIGQAPTGSILTGADIADGSISTAKIADTAISTAKVADNSITTAKTAFNDIPFRNRIINGDLSVAQRGTSFTNVASGTYTIDRWNMSYRAVGNADIAQVDNKTYKSLKVTNSNASSQEIAMRYRVEDVTQFNNDSFVLSFYAKASTSVTLDTRVYENYGSGGSTTVNVVTSGSQNKTITTSRQRFSITFTTSDMSSKTIGTSNYLEFSFHPTLISSANWEFDSVQLEQGTTASDFEFIPFDVNLQRCQRYYFCSDTVSSATEFYPCFCSSAGSTPDSIKFTAPVPFRSPDNVTITASAGTSQLIGGGYSSTTTVPTFTRRNNTNDVDGTTKPSGSGTKIYFVTNALFSGISEGYAGFGTTGKLEFDNEL